ncbi:hypothetical protein BJX66DRAFT_302957 [Aspergillus keveii]|uniref:Uncharacterized protein n=1 Tax=Aspergillus keveii TaxID=714993 RepID=A0ABR4G7B1_9EURO
MSLLRNLLHRADRPHIPPHLPGSLASVIWFVTACCVMRAVSMTLLWVIPRALKSLCSAWPTKYALLSTI